MLFNFKLCQNTHIFKFHLWIFYRVDCGSGTEEWEKDTWKGAWKKRSLKSNFYCDWNWYHYDMMIINIFNSNNSLNLSYSRAYTLIYRIKLFYEFLENVFIYVCRGRGEGTISNECSESLIFAFAKRNFYEFSCLFDGKYIGFVKGLVMLLLLQTTLTYDTHSTDKGIMTF